MATKRAADVALAGCGLFALLPLLLLIAAVVKLDSPGPALYRATRVGRKGRRFVCYKFRTMIPEADAAKDDLRSLNERDGAFFKIANDPRITRIGRFHRRGEVGHNRHGPGPRGCVRLERMKKEKFLKTSGFNILNYFE